MVLRYVRALVVCMRVKFDTSPPLLRNVFLFLRHNSGDARNLISTAAVASSPRALYGTTATAAAEAARAPVLRAEEARQHPPSGCYAVIAVLANPAVRPRQHNSPVAAVHVHCIRYVKCARGCSCHDLRGVGFRSRKLHDGTVHLRLT